MDHSVSAINMPYICGMNIFKSAFILSGVFLTGLSACNTSTPKKETSTGDANKVEEKSTSPANNIDRATSTVVWHGSDLLKTHTGTIEIISGEMKLDEKGKLTGGSISIDMNSILVTDKTPEDKKPKLIGHLKSNDFFAADSFPTSIFEIANVEQKDGDNYVIHGNLTIRGKVLGVEVPAIITTKEGTTNVKANFAIDRTKWGVNFHSKTIDASIKDKFINDMIELNVDLNAKK
jgi:polyisoprenoid-binding protein YceI